MSSLFDNPPDDGLPPVAFPLSGEAAATGWPFLPDQGQGFEQGLVENAPEGILVVDARGQIVLANQAIARLSGHPAQWLVGQPVSVLVPTGDRAHHGGHVADYFAHPRSRGMGQVSRLHLLRRDGVLVPVDISLGHCHRHGEPCALVFVKDMSELLKLHEQLQHQATHDALTGLHNRWMFQEALAQAVAHALRTAQPLAVLLIDLDDFKAINDAHGHLAGDDVLKTVAQRLRTVLRADDSLARLGGDEFGVLLRDLREPSDAVLVAQKLVQLVGQPCKLARTVVHPGASIGVAYAPQDAQDAETLMRFADLAMYQAKDGGRGCCVPYAAGMSYLLDEKLLIHDRLKHALENNHLALHYQPQVNLATGRVEAVEALLRWHDAELGDVPPARFIPVAESTGLMPALGDWVLETACRQLAEWAQQGLETRVAVNVSAQQFRQRELADRLEHCLRLGGVSPHLLELEVTESAAMADPKQAAEVLDRLMALGVGVALDDFGTGYSSLAYLRDLPVSRLKIDREFVKGVALSASDSTLARAVIGLARTLGKTVVAEGVENQAQLAFLCMHGCEIYQGWLFSKAVPASDVPRLLQKLDEAMGCQHCSVHKQCNNPRRVLHTA